jgi:hypothetical protein
MSEYEGIPDETPIWRYIPLGPFLELLMNSALFQTSVRVFEDGAEGAYGYKATRIDDSVPRSLLLEPSRYMDASGLRQLPFKTPDVIKAARERTAVTCWFKHSGTESYGMWRIYGRDPFAVAIATSVGALRSILAGQTTTRVGAVAYRPLPAVVQDAHTLFFHKREEYQAEQEIRSIYVSQQPLDGRFLMWPLAPEQLDALLSKIIVAPAMRPTMYDTLLAVVKGKFESLGLAFDSSRMTPSSLDRDVLL